MRAKRKKRLTRSGLRDLIILFCAISALFFRPSAFQAMVAFAFLVTGSFIHLVSKGVLIRNEVLCREGIYGMVRHPYYLANYLVDTAFCLLSGSLYLVLLYPFLFFWSYGPTMRKEEGTLNDKHGDASLVFMLEAPAVFPDRHSASRFASLFTGFSPTRVSPKELARIVRFWAVALIITGIGRIGAIRDLPGSLLANEGLLFLFCAAVLLYGASAAILRFRKRTLLGLRPYLSSECTPAAAYALRTEKTIGGSRAVKR